MVSAWIQYVHGRVWKNWNDTSCKCTLETSQPKDGDNHRQTDGALLETKLQEEHKPTSPKDSWKNVTNNAKIEKKKRGKKTLKRPSER